MNRDDVIGALDVALTGRFAHPDPAAALAGLTAEAAGELPDGTPRTIHDLVGHLVYWQDVTLDWIGGIVPEQPSDPEEPWPAGPRPASQEAWDALVARFTAGLERGLAVAREADLTAPMPGMAEATPLGCLQVMGNHNSYHLGQIVMLRRRLGAWPG